MTSQDGLFPDCSWNKEMDTIPTIEEEKMLMPDAPSKDQLLAFSQKAGVRVPLCWNQ